MNDLLQLLGHAWSFSGLEPPEGSEHIGVVEKDGMKFLLFEGKTEDGEDVIFYETEQGFEFKRQMDEAEKRRKKKRRRI